MNGDGRMMTRQAANVLSATRLALAPWLATAILAGDARLGLLLFALAAISDVADGWVARRWSVTSRLGRWLDHASDIVFLLGGYVAFAWRGTVPWWVPLSIAAAFAVYVGDSLTRAPGGHLRGSRLGHLGGVMNYVLLGFLLGASALGLAAPAGPLPMVAVLWVVPLYSGASIAARLRATGRRPALADARSDA